MNRCKLAFLVVVLATVSAAIGWGGSPFDGYGAGGSVLSERGAMAPIGPLAGLRWPAAEIHAGMLLHDDGTHLWSVPLKGEPVLLWTHPKVDVDEITASPDGQELAYSIFFANVSSERSVSAVLYLLRRDGLVRTIDAVRSFESIESEQFLRAPTDPTGPVRLYWIRISENVRGSDDRIKTQVMMLTDRGPTEIHIPLRYGEAPIQLSGYPGSATVSLTLVRTNDNPTRYEILNVWGTGSTTSADLTHWGAFTSTVQTDSAVGVAWLNASDRVVYVWQQLHRPQASLRLYRVGCEFFGAKVIHQGDEIDPGFVELPWPMLTAGSDRVLVLGAKALAAIFKHKAKSAHWIAVDVRSGHFQETDAVWTPGGWWTYVLPPLKQTFAHPPKDCNGFTVYP